MRADYYAKTVIGVKLHSEEDFPKAKILVRKKAFDHDYKDGEGIEFYPKNGRSLWLEEKEEVEASYDFQIVTKQKYRSPISL